MSNFSSLLAYFCSAFVSSQMASLTLLLIVIGTPELRRLPVMARINKRNRQPNTP